MAVAVGQEGAEGLVRKRVTPARPARLPAHPPHCTPTAAVAATAQPLATTRRSLKGSDDGQNWYSAHDLNPCKAAIEAERCHKGKYRGGWRLRRACLAPCTRAS